MRLFLLGASYKTASIELREKMALTRREIGEMIQFFCGDERILETVILTTCNRTEFYFVCKDFDAENLIWNWLEKRTDISKKNLYESVYIYTDSQVINHLYKVVSGLGSMVLGEEQILGQVREAYQLAIEADGVSTFFHHLFSEALRVGKRVRTETKIAHSGASISSAAVKLVKKMFPDLSKVKGMVLGAGQMGNLALQSLYDAGMRNLVIVNRNEEKRNELASRFNGTPIAWEEKRKALYDVDLVISSTSAPHFVITYEDLEERISSKESPLLLIDIAVPRDIEPSLRELPNIEVYNIDDLQQVAIEWLNAGYKDEIQLAQNLIRSEEEKFRHWLRIREVEPIIKALRQKAEVIRQQELSRIKAQLDSLDEQGQTLIKELTHKMIGKLLHEPTIQLKKIAEQDQNETYLAMICQLYNLEIPS